MKMSAELVSFKASLVSVQMVVSSLYLYKDLPLYWSMPKFPVLTRTPVLIGLGPTLMTSF